MFLLGVFSVFCCFFLSFAQASQKNDGEVTLSLSTEMPPSFSSYTTKYHQRLVPKLAAFFQENEAVLSAVQTVVYPFGGPDILYPLALYPRAKTFVLMGLEYSGIPSLIEKKICEAGAQKELTSLVGKSFFITRDMAQSFSKACGNGATILLQLRLMGVDQVHVSFVNQPAPGLHYRFIYQEKERHLYYFKTNLHRDHLSQTLLDFLKAQPGPWGAFMKATSYMPHQEGYGSITAWLTQVCDTILQDDSGIPFAQLKDFNVTLWGPYQQPYGVEFLQYTQKDLKLAFSQPHALGFCFGYGCGRQKTVLMLAVKKKDITS